MSSPTPVKPKRSRDLRLDFFRGLCLVIIFIAHIWNNPWSQFIPARFGFSDATEIFVFCSGMASAAAFGSVFRTHGFLLGCARVAIRCWQVYWSHIGVMLAAATAMIWVDMSLGTPGGYLGFLGLTPLTDHNAGSALAGLLSLRWVPFYFDILPMYLVILAMIPAVVALKRLGTAHVVMGVFAVWLVANLGYLDLPAEPWSERAWFFNPFAWQLVFFTGFAFMSGWIPAPRTSRLLVKLTAAVLVLTLPFAWGPLTEQFESLQHARAALAPLIDKTHFGILRYVHFLSLAYLAYVAAGDHGHRLSGPVAETLRRLGQQSLAVFMTGLLLSFLASTVLNLAGHSLWSVPLVNLTGIAILIAVARLTAFFKAQPWSKPIPVQPAASPTRAARSTFQPAE